MNVDIESADDVIILNVGVIVYIVVVIVVAVAIVVAVDPISITEPN